ncbi:hypothetical protein ACTMTF_07860 [Nonomuraea sp. ZG12]|uniref:hypothetical protein n=1 Tax=Nonomuraea sp. ZG12 TaxID=3452207 RepID=UPI003F8A3ACB
MTATVQRPGVAAGARDNSGTHYFRGRPGVFKVKRLSNSRIAPKSTSGTGHRAARPHPVDEPTPPWTILRSA